ncbi:MAG: hypothetical protein MSA53_05445 [Bacteroidales bacterium]|nr:hypothetical protein [Bacteroidales bacterium]
MMKKKIFTYAGIVLLLLVVAYSFTPWVLTGKIVNQSDISSWKGMAAEAVAWNEAHPDDPTAWTGSMFSGMPTTAVIDDFKGDWTRTIYDFLLTGRRPASYIFIALLGAFLLMLSLGVSPAIAVAGAIAVAFCSYNMQIIQVGHNTKMQAIAYFPWVMAALIFTYNSALKQDNAKKWLPQTILGSVLFALALSMQIKANHIQITYYLAIVIFCYAIGLFISLCAEKKEKKVYRNFFVASLLLLVIGCIGIATNANKLIPTYEYTPYTMRGGSELSSDKDSHNSKGLDLDYATAWSYGINEMPNLLIPNFNGGSSAGPLPLDSNTGNLLKSAGQPNLKSTMKALPLYWGPQPFTAGPMYLGAISIFLFVLGLMLCRGREKWWLAAATLIAILLSWGNHFMWFTKLWFDYAPFYNKFRTVSMALTILQVTVPMLGFLVLDHILKGQYDKKRLARAGWIAYGVTAGFCLVCVIFPGIAGSFTSSGDSAMPDILADALAEDRRGLLVKDAIRSFLLISGAFALILWSFLSKKESRNRSVIVAFCIAVLVWADLFSVDKRYLNGDHFVTKRDFAAVYNPREVDKMIHEDTDPSFRVLDISTNTFNDAIQSYHHKCIGGYSPVKLQRYQDLIDRFLQGEIRQIYDVVGESETIGDVSDNLPFLKAVSMLNTRYIILAGDYPPVVNQWAMGNCWWVNDWVVAGNADEEIALLEVVDPSTQAVLDKAGAEVTSGMLPADEGMEDEGMEKEGEIYLESYAPNQLIYSYSTPCDRVAVFSEVYYPKGWKAWVEPLGSDGEKVELELFRADWILRAARIPAGEGKIIMRFEPESYKTGAAVSRASSIVLILLILLSCGGIIYISRNEASQSRK